MNDRLSQLALFVRTAESGSFSKTAREFGLTQPSVSRSVAALEARLGVTLLRRTTRKLSLTGAGEALLVRARDALAAVDDAESAALGADRLSGTLRIALPTAYGVREVIPRLAGFLALHPTLRVDAMLSDRYEDLIAEGADLALRIGSQPDSSFVTRKLATTERYIVAAPDYLRRRGTPRRLEDLAKHDCLGGPSDAPREVWSFRHRGTEKSVTVDIRVRTGRGLGLVACAAAGLGIAVTSTWMCGEEIERGELVRLLPDHTPEPVDAFLVFPAGRKPSQKARAFSDYLVREMGRGGKSAAHPERPGTTR